MLYLFGVLNFLIIYSNQYDNNLKENIPFYIELKDNANQATVFAFQKKLQTSAYVKSNSVEYLTKEDALSGIKDNNLLTKEDVLLFGENLLPNMIRFFFNNEYFDDYKNIVEDIQSYNFVELVFFSEDRVYNLESRVFPYEIILLVLMIFFIFVIIILTSNKIKLVLVSDKEVVGKLQKTGSSPDIITKPYFVQSVSNGLIGGILSLGGIWATWFFLNVELDTQDMFNMNMWTVILSSILIFGVLFFSWIYTRHIIHKLTSKPVEEWDL
ncbi:permease-like cell division protein FtsX [Aureispira]|nr:permease-like cell division protein FtsX [Aureispira sp.]